jgi:hypothetical protein
VYFVLILIFCNFLKLLTCQVIRGWQKTHVFCKLRIAAALSPYFPPLVQLCLILAFGSAVLCPIYFPCRIHVIARSSAGPLRPTTFPRQPSSPDMVSILVLLFLCFFLLKFVLASFGFYFCCFFYLFRYTLWVMILGFHLNFFLHLSAPLISSAHSTTKRHLLGFFSCLYRNELSTPFPILVSSKRVIGSSFWLLSSALCASMLFIFL